MAGCNIDHMARARMASQILRDSRRKRIVAAAENAHGKKVLDGSVDYLDGVMPTGAWAGRRCFIICGGPSLRGFDYERLRGELVIGVNRAFESFDPCLLYSVDTRYLSWVMTDQYKPDAGHVMRPAERFERMLGTKIWCRESGKTGFGGGIKTIECNYTSGPSWSLEGGLPKQNNSGFGALNLALCLGASTVYMLGLDLHGENGKQAWCHSGHPVVFSDNRYPDFRAQFEGVASEISAHGVRVVNLNPDSALRCFEFSTFNEVMSARPTPARPVVVGYYTCGTGYEAEAREMIASAHRFGMDTDVLAIGNLGGWQENTRFKAQFLRDMVLKYQGRSIVYTDADSRFVRYPALFDEPLRGIRYHLHKGGELLSGTLQIACNADTEKLMDLWVEECLRNPVAWDQRSLAVAVEKWNGPVEFMPKEYCCIFDSKPQPDAPVVLHYQASRRLKAEVGR